MESHSTPLLSEFIALGHTFMIAGEVVAAEIHGSGHINDTFAVTVSESGSPRRYIFQRINHTIFKDIAGMMDNILRVTAHQKLRLQGGADAERRSLTVLTTYDGRPFTQDQAGNVWRVYRFIENARTYDRIESPVQAYQAAKAFGEFQRLLVDLPGERLHETIPGFHNTPQRFAACEAAIHADVANRVRECAQEIAFARQRASLANCLIALQTSGQIPERVTHNDTKINNVMLDETTQESLCVIDLDTVMPGISLYDFGDMVRSATNAAPEDERDYSKVHARREIFAALAKGFLTGCGAILNEVERANLVRAGQVVTYELGLRFLTDYLQGDVYFKTKRPQQNLDRTRTHFALLRSLEAQELDFQHIVSSQTL